MNKENQQSIIKALVSHSDFKLRYSYGESKIEDDDAAHSKTVQRLFEQFQRDPSIFVERYGNLLTIEELNNIQQAYEQDFEVQHYLQPLLKQKGIVAAPPSTAETAKTKKQTNNRRYQAMKQMEAETDYFSLEQMRLRQPKLYEIYVSEYRDVKTPFRKDMKMYERLLYNYDLCTAQDAEKKHVASTEEEEESEESELEDEDGEEEEEDDSEKKPQLQQQASMSFMQELAMKHGMPSDDDSGLIDPKVLEEQRMLERQEYEQQFVSMMKWKFMNGEDKEHFDYSTVDNNTNYDNMEELNRDEEERYFDQQDDEAFEDAGDLDEAEVP